MTEPVSIPPVLFRPPDVPPAEADALLDGALVAPSEDLVAEITGPGSVMCLQGLLTNDLEAPGEEAFVYGAVLSPKGMILCDLWAARSAGMVTLTYPPQGREALIEVFQRSLPPRLAKFTDRAGQRLVLRLAGPTALQVAEAAGLAIPPAGRVARSAFRPSDCLVARPPLGQPFALQLLVADSDVPVVMDALERAGAVSGGAGALELARILAGWPKLGVEIDHKTLPQEVRYDEINGVSYTKGCYTGQETVARLHFRGHTNRHLVGLTWQQPPDTEQAAIAQDEKTIGRVSSVAWLAPLEHYVGLGIVRREMDVTRPVMAGGTLARAAELPIRLAS